MSVNTSMTDIGFAFGESRMMDTGVVLSLVSIVISLIALIIVIRGL